MRLRKDDSPNSSQVSQPSRDELDPKDHKQTSTELQDGRCHNVHHREAYLPKERETKCNSCGDKMCPRKRHDDPMSEIWLQLLGSAHESRRDAPICQNSCFLCHTHLSESQLQ